MKIPSACKLELTASIDPKRPSLWDPHLDLSDPKAPVCVATNGVILAVVPVEPRVDEGSGCPGDISGVISVDALQAARRVKGARKNGAEINASDEEELSVGISKYARPARKYPDWRQVVPPKDRKPAFTVGLNVKQLWQLVQALGCESVTLEFGETVGDVVVVKPTHATTLDESLSAAEPADRSARGYISTTRTGV